MDLENIISKIIQNRLFLRLKNVVENSPFHDHEKVYDHLIKTKDIAQREIKGKFITNLDAKKLFLEYVNQDFDGCKRAEIMIIAALLHDIGKILYVKQRGFCRSIKITDSQEQTTIPGHEYWGSTIADNFLNEFKLTSEQIKYISSIIRLHDCFQGPYFPSKTDWNLEKIINDIKSRAEGMYIESMFNNFCDVYNSIPFQSYKETVINIFNNPSLYEPREYIIP